jgi:hypothetical protein
LTKPPDASQTYYLTFEPDMAGFNNMRMSLECAVAFAAITGRTLVLPDSWSIDHIGVIGQSIRTRGLARPRLERARYEYLTFRFRHTEAV